MGWILVSFDRASDRKEILTNIFFSQQGKKPGSRGKLVSNCSERDSSAISWFAPWPTINPSKLWFH